MVEQQYPLKHYAERSKLSQDQLLKFVHSGELRAVNLAGPGAQRPRWYVSAFDWSSFVAKRANRKPDRPVTDRRDRDVPEYV